MKEALLKAEADAFAWRQLLQSVINHIAPEIRSPVLDLARKTLAESEPGRASLVAETAIAGRKPTTIGKYQARHPVHLRDVLARLDERGDDLTADTLCWLVWHVERAENTTAWVLNDALAPDPHRASYGSPGPN